jgi:capsular exopolysaccharide synthesis family protein
MSQENLVEFEDYVAAIGRRKKLIAIVVIACVVLGAAYSVLSTKQYTAESRVSVTPVFDPSSPQGEEVNIETERGIAKSSAVAGIAQEILGSNTSPADLLDRLSVSVVGDSTILSIKYSHTDPESAFRGANAFAQAYLDFRSSEADSANRQAREQTEGDRDDKVQQRTEIESQLQSLERGTPEYDEAAAQAQTLDGQISQLEAQLQDLRSQSQADPGTIFDEAEVPGAPSSPGLLLNVAGATVIGLLLALTATFVLERKNLGNRRDPEPVAPRTEPPATAIEAPAEPVPPRLPPALESALPARSVPTPAPAPAPEPTPEPAVQPVAATPPAPEPQPLIGPESAMATEPFVGRPRGGRPRTIGALPAATAAPTPEPVVEPEPEPEPVPAAAGRSADRRQRRDPSHALGPLKVELLGNVPRLSNDAGEALRRLHATLWPRLEQHGAKVVFITSAIERGVTVVLAGGLAASAALAGLDALLIAGDLHQPRLHDRLELGNDQGLAEVLSGARPMTQVLQGWSGIENLCVVTAGRPGPDPSALVSPDRLANQLNSVRDEFQLIVIEGPPVGETPDATVMASVADAVVLAVDPRHSAENELGGAVSRLRLAKAPLLGAVVVEARAPRTGIPPMPAAPVPSRG